MGACQSRLILTKIEDLIFSLGSIYSFLLSHLSAVVNRFYSLLLSPIVRVDDENVPSRLCDEKTGICLRPKDRLRQRKKTELRLKRAELAARGIDPALALKRRDSHTSNASVALGDRGLKRWSRAESMPIPGPNSGASSPRFDEATSHHGRASRDVPRQLNVVMQPLNADGGGGGATAKPVKQPGGAVRPSGKINSGPTSSSRSHQQLSPLAEPPTATNAKRAAPPARPIAADYRHHRLSLQVEPQGIRMRREDAKVRQDTAMGPSHCTGLARTSLDTRPPAAVETLSRARQSLDVQLREHGFSRTQTMPLSLTPTASRESPVGWASKEASPRSSVCDLANAACKAGANKKARKMWREELDKVARSRVRGVGGGP
ncbi:unnamed protein product [Parajaminaea phylloscopi]